MKTKVVRAWAISNKDEGFYYCDIGKRNLMVFKKLEEAIAVRDLWAPSHNVIQVEIRPIPKKSKKR